MVREEKLSAVLSDFARTLLADLPLQVTLDHIVNGIANVLPVMSVGLTLSSVGAVPRFAGSDALALSFERMQTTLGQGPARTVVESGDAVHSTDQDTEEQFSFFTAAALQAGIAAAFAFPLQHQNRRLGTLTFYRGVAGPLDADDLATAQTLADVAAAFVLNARARAEAVASSDRFRDSSLRDPLTGLPNRLLLDQRLQHAGKRAKRTHTNAAILFADLDRFKNINDTYGHQVGDELLVAVARRLSAMVRPGDTLARVGGDEFVFLCEDISSPDDIEALAARIDAAFLEPFALSSLDVSVTASVGMAFAGPGEDISRQLVMDADIAMYQVKRKGGGAHQLIDLREAREASARNTLEHDLNTAFAHHELDIAYQPIVRSHDGVVTGVEALLRWNHPGKGAIPASDLVSIAEDNGLIVRIGEWVLERGCADRRRWRRDRPNMPLDLAVNVSTRQLMAPGFPATVEAILKRTNMDPAALILEVTEAVFIGDAERAMIVLADLKALGVRLALDDFGTGFCSLNYLRRFPVDILKIDKTFVRAITEDVAGATIVAATADLAHLLGLSVVAEGVETDEEHREITRMGCDFAQGFHFARPLPAAEFVSLLEANEDHRLSLPALAP